MFCSGAPVGSDLLTPTWDPCWHLRILADISGSFQTSQDHCWHFRILADISVSFPTLTLDPCGHLGILVDISVSLLTYQDLCWHFSIFADINHGSLLTTQDPCGHLRIFADDSGSLLTSQDPCGYFTIFADINPGSLLTSWDCWNLETTSLSSPVPLSASHDYHVDQCCDGESTIGDDSFELKDGRFINSTEVCICTDDNLGIETAAGQFWLGDGSSIGKNWDNSLACIEATATSSSSVG